METGWVDAIFGTVDTIVDASTGTSKAKAEATQAAAELEKIKLAQQQLEASQRPREWISGVPNWVLFAAGGGLLLGWYFSQ